ncbi:MAG: prenyltransferase/squalene oxidase repeat-containing protein [Armatimonadota bacterium]
MLQVARLAPRLLSDSAELVADFLRSQLHPDGGFCDRAGESDLYYTVFGLEGLLALQADLPVSQIAAYLRRFGDGDGLDFIHLTCLARGWAALPLPLRAEVPRDAIAARLETHRSADGGYHTEPGTERGTVYGCFMALGGYQDLGLPLPDPEGVLRCVRSLRAFDGGYANQEEVPMGLTPSTAAAATLLRHLGEPAEPALAEWLLARCLPEGGFFATPVAPIPDLLSTATALHALSGLKADYEAVREPCLDFVDSLWTNRGAFYGNWTDDCADCEYTYYGLLSLGHLSL